MGHAFCQLFMFLQCFLSLGLKKNNYTHPSALLRPLLLCCSVVCWHHKLLAWIKSALRDKILSAVHFKICTASLSIHQTLCVCLSVYLWLTGINAQPKKCSWLYSGSSLKKTNYLVISSLAREEGATLPENMPT